MSKPTHRYTLLIVLILVIGGALRLFQLGHDSLWLDEAGVAIAALKPSLAGTLDAVRQHAMAMPLDYLVIKLFGLIGISEFWLRLPSAIWGTLTLWVCYCLFQQFNQRRVALLATSFLAVFPLLVRYSQELRFYASLVFFYSLTTLLIVKALSSNRWRGWIWVTCAAVVGAYFHIYVVLAYMNGAAILFAQEKSAQNIRTRWVRLLISLAVTGLLVFPGYLSFGGEQTFHLPLLQFYSSIFEVIALAFGWVPSRYVNFMIGGFILGLSILGLELIGATSSLRLKKWRDLALITSAFLQGLLVLGGDWLKGYWVFFRQFIFLVPISLYFAALGAEQLWQWLSTRFGQQWRWLRVGFVLIMLAANVAALSEYYNWEKSGARQITSTLLQNWHPGDKVELYPAGDEVIYQYYLGTVFRQPQVLSSFQLSTLSSLEQLDLTPRGRFLIADFTRQEAPPAAIVKEGFELIRAIDIVNWGSQTLYIRSDP